MALPSLWKRPLKDVVTGFTSGVVSQAIGFIFKAGFEGLNYILDNGILTSGSCHGGIRYYVGLVFYVYHQFFCSFFNVLYDNGINKPKKKEAEGVATDPTDNALLCEIRDLLKE